MVALRPPRFEPIFTSYKWRKDLRQIIIFNWRKIRRIFGRLYQS